MAPTTPSPFRFVSNKQRAKTPEKQHRAPTALRDQLQASHDVHTASPYDAFASGRQFAATPRFSFAKAKPASVTKRLPSPPTSNLASALRSTVPPREDVEDVPSSAHDEDDDMLDNEQAQAVPTMEDGRGMTGPWNNDLTHTPKRRKATPRAFEKQEIEVHPLPAVDDGQPSDPNKAALQTSVPCFVPPAESPRPAAYASSYARSRPFFLKSSDTGQESSEPLPDVFSPHRRGDKFVPGGMAATMQTWILQTGQAAIQGRKQQAFQRADDCSARLKVEELLGQGPYTAKARTMGGTATNILLAKDLNVSGDSRVSVVVGHVVGIRAPSWQVEIEGEMWLVAVDWKIIE
ncbi:hypothetical protein KC343_g2421 [Hortaea werneckii]|uniref:Uncharacterized protein n=1 Tax=Hortaea werneckii TaxID=91943 RepID=A0A3M7GD76_HORWE|nr:hypothetical protein KC352_g7835 [Hortaea werneckii]KAI7568302.1 hypothetical protein KC317_g4322 [Hortaea werneckii]KAI7624208.1 hypothetical protein KC346_g2318 [Hortaea werneckii]KAI7634404.1 hypothetical protein KC343_g2421 [Hortaea werneckii]KAI7680272.1 hypothetical protein KC319_g2264 [Hortaea werneckii]